MTKAYDFFPHGDSRHYWFAQKAVLFVDHMGNYGIDLFGSDRALIGRQWIMMSLDWSDDSDRRIKGGKKENQLRLQLFGERSEEKVY